MRDMRKVKALAERMRRLSRAVLEEVEVVVVAIRRAWADRGYKNGGESKLGVGICFTCSVYEVLNVRQHLGSAYQYRKCSLFQAGLSKETRRK